MTRIKVKSLSEMAQVLNDDSHHRVDTGFPSFLELYNFSLQKIIFLRNPTFIERTRDGNYLNLDLSNGAVINFVPSDTGLQDFYQEDGRNYREYLVSSAYQDPHNNTRFSDGSPSEEVIVLGSRSKKNIKLKGDRLILKTACQDRYEMYDLRDSSSAEKLERFIDILKVRKESEERFLGMFENS
jgi:hypothetical protein